MQIQKCSPSFGNRFKLSTETIKAAEKSTGLTYSEMTNSSLDECTKLMFERGTLKKTSKFKTWLADKYQKLGEALGLLEKKHYIYTDID